MKKINFYMVLSKIVLNEKMTMKDYIALQVISDNHFIAYLDSDLTISLVFEIGIERIEIVGKMKTNKIIVDNVYRKLKKKRV